MSKDAKLSISIGYVCILRFTSHPFYLAHYPPKPCSILLIEFIFILVISDLTFTNYQVLAYIDSYEEKIREESKAYADKNANNRNGYALMNKNEEISNNFFKKTFISIKKMLSRFVLSCVNDNESSSSLLI